MNGLAKTWLFDTGIEGKNSNLEGKKKAKLLASILNNHYKGNTEKVMVKLIKLIELL